MLQTVHHHSYTHACVQCSRQCCSLIKYNLLVLYILTEHIFFALSLARSRFGIHYVGVHTQKRTHKQCLFDNNNPSTLIYVCHFTLITSKYVWLRYTHANHVCGCVGSSVSIFMYMLKESIIFIVMWK